MRQEKVLALIILVERLLYIRKGANFSRKSSPQFALLHIICKEHRFLAPVIGV